jgi:hypothetical protein
MSMLLMVMFINYILVLPTVVAAITIPRGGNIILATLTATGVAVSWQITAWSSVRSAARAVEVAAQIGNK